MQHKFDTPKDGDYARYVEALVRRSALELRVSPHQPGTMGGADPISRPSHAPAVVRPASTAAASATKPAHRAARSAPSAPSDKAQRAAAAATAVLQAARSGKVNELSADAKKWLTRVGVGVVALVFLWPVIREFTRGMDGVEVLFFGAVVVAVAARALFSRRS
jgi:hypothetical protein